MAGKLVMRLTKNGKNTKGKASLGFSARGAVGIDVTQNAIKMVYLSGRNLNQVQLEKYSVVRLPKNIIKGNRILDYDQLVSYLQHAYTQLNTNNRNIVVAMPQTLTTIETVSYSAKDTEMDVEDFAEFEIAQLVPLEEVNYDYQMLSGSGNSSQNKLLLVASRKEDIEPRLEAFDSANLTPKFLDVDIFAQANAFNYWLNDQSPELQGEKVVVVNISESEMYSLVMQDGQILYKQESPLGGEQLNQLIQRIYQVSEEQAQVMQKGGDRPADYQIQISDRFNVQVAQEIQRVLQFYYTTQSGEQFSNIKHIFLTGAVSAQIGLTEVIFSQTNTAAECINPISCLQYGKQVDPSELHQDGSGLTVAFGLALRGL